MTYTRTTWATNDTITAAKLNNMELGILAASAAANGFVAFNGDTTGTTAVGDALLTAATAAVAAGVPLIIPPGNYLISSTGAPIMPKGLTMKCSRGARFFGSSPGGNLMWWQDDTRIEGGVYENTSTDACFCVWIAGNGNTTVTGATFKGAGASGLFLNYADLDGVLIDNCTFDTLVYGILLNSGANNAKNITVQRSRFRNIAADAIEINAVTGGGTNRVRGLKVINNPEIRADAAVTGDSAGFGVGLAGCIDFTVSGNTFISCRNEGVHIEDGSARGVVSSNTFYKGVNTQRGAVVIYQGCADITVADNVIREFSGKGVVVVYDSNGASKNIHISDNTIVAAGGTSAIQVGGEAGFGPYHVTGNTIINPVGHGIEVFGAHELSVVDGNVITGAGGYGVQTSGPGSGTRVYRNIIVAPTSGSYNGGGEVAFTNGGGTAGTSGPSPDGGSTGSGGGGSGGGSSAGTSSGATHDPSTITGMTGRWRAGSITGLADGAKVNTWPDSSGNSFPGLQATDSLAPTYVASSLNSKPGVRWPASGTTFMTTQSPAGQSTQTVVAIIKPTTAGVAAGVTIAVRGEDDISGLELRFVGGVPGNMSQNQVDLGPSTGSVAANVGSVVVSTYSGSAGSTYKVNGTARGTSSTTATLNTLRKTWIGANGAQTGEFFQGDILELITFSRVLTSSEIVQIDSYAQEWYGITVADYAA